MNDITLLITFYNPTDKQISYWESFYKKYSNKINLHFLVDNPNLRFSDNIKNIFYNENNIGKFKTIYNHIKAGFVETSHFKIVDPDDLISIRNFGKIPDLKKGKIYLFNGSRGDDLEDKSQKNVDYFISKSKKLIWKASFGNSWTILPTNKIYDDEFYSGINIFAADDQLLGFISLANNASVEYIDISFYWYTMFNGNTSCINLNTYLKNCISTFKEIKSIVKKSGMDKYSNWPFNHKFSKERIENCKGHNYRENKKLLKKLKKISIYK